MREAALGFRFRFRFRFRFTFTFRVKSCILMREAALDDGSRALLLFIGLFR